MKIANSIGTFGPHGFLNVGLSDSSISMGSGICSFQYAVEGLKLDGVDLGPTFSFPLS